MGGRLETAHGSQSTMPSGASRCVATPKSVARSTVPAIRRRDPSGRSARRRLWTCAPAPARERCPARRRRLPRRRRASRPPGGRAPTGRRRHPSRDRRRRWFPGRGARRRRDLRTRSEVEDGLRVPDRPRGEGSLTGEAVSPLRSGSSSVTTTGTPSHPASRQSQRIRSTTAAASSFGSLRRKPSCTSTTARTLPSAFSRRATCRILPRYAAWPIRPTYARGRARSGS